MCHISMKEVAQWKCMQKHAGVCERIITPEEDSYAALVAKRNRNDIPNQIAADLAVATDAHVSARTFSLRLNKVPLYAQNLVRYIPLKLRHY